MQNIQWVPSNYLNKELLPDQEEIVKGKHRIVFWNDSKDDKLHTFTNSRGPNSDYSFTGAIPNIPKEDAKKILVDFMLSGMLCYYSFLKKNNIRFDV